jgi:hypothetical protein
MDLSLLRSPSANPDATLALSGRSFSLPCPIRRKVVSLCCRQALLTATVYPDGSAIELPRWHLAERGFSSRKPVCS